jgi:hypothetical protein
MLSVATVCLPINQSNQFDNAPYKGGIREENRQKWEPPHSQALGKRALAVNQCLG